MTHVPEYVKDFLRKLPDNWEDVRFIDGEPGKLFVVARKAGSKWYVAGINGENAEKILSLDLSFLNNKKGTFITSGSPNGDEPSFETKNAVLQPSGKLNITLRANDGFVAVFE
jgi:alpha-glucosidase